MSAVETIEKALATDLLMDDLTIVPERGADDAEVAVEEGRLSRRLSQQHKRLLSRWNGIGLEVVRFFGCGDSTGEVGRIADFQVAYDFGLEGVIVIGSDASGFAYLEDGHGRIHSFDTDGGTVKQIANDLDDFLDRVVFGAGAAEFSGEEWLTEVRESGLIA